MFSTISVQLPRSSVSNLQPTGSRLIKIDGTFSICWGNSKMGLTFKKVPMTMKRSAYVAPSEISWSFNLICSPKSTISGLIEPLQLTQHETIQTLVDGLKSSIVYAWLHRRSKFSRQLPWAQRRWPGEIPCSKVSTFCKYERRNFLCSSNASKKKWVEENSGVGTRMASFANRRNIDGSSRKKVKLKILHGLERTPDSLMVS